MLRDSVFSISLLLLYFISFIRCKIDYYLYDLSKDPNESNNVYFDERYSDDVTYLKERIEYWSDYTVQADTQSTAEEDKSSWSECNCVKPWLKDDYSREIEQKYYPENPPHIVFVLVDDLGWNDIGYQSTYQSWTTPVIDLLAAEGIKLSNYYTHDSCTPSRGALMTGRYSIRLGFQVDGIAGAELNVTEITLAQELKSAGYRTNMVGKWHLGFSSQARLPNKRGFDYFYGYYNGYIDYYDKTFGGYIDLHEQGHKVTSVEELSSDLHSAFVFQSKAEEVISNHANNYPDDPMFLYYALQLTHFPYEPPENYLSRCYNENTEAHSFCGMSIMLDEAIANLTCSLRQNNMIDNTILIFASDNGGSAYVIGSSYPFRGHKFSLNRGGISAHAFIHSPLIPDNAKGTVYDGLFHVTDWLPTIMNLATNGEWTGSYNDHEIDGVNMWDAVINQEDSPREEIVNYYEDGVASIIYKNLKFDVNVVQSNFDEVDYVTDSEIRETTYKCNLMSLQNDNEFILPDYDVVHHDNPFPRKDQSFIDMTKHFNIYDLTNYHYTAIVSLFAVLAVVISITIYKKMANDGYERITSSDDIRSL